MSPKLPVVAFGIAACACFAVSLPPAPSQPQKAAIDLPIAVQCEIDGDFSEGHGWRLRVETDGGADLRIVTLPRYTQRRFQVSSAQRNRLATVIEAERFFDLEDTYGDTVYDSSTRILTITRGNRRKTVTLLYLRDGDPKREEIERTLRVWHMVRSWFDDAEAVDLRRYHQPLPETP